MIARKGAMITRNGVDDLAWSTPEAGARARDPGGMGQTV
jgi:hypothetical protein